MNLEITEDFFPGLVKYLDTDTERAVLVLEEIPGVKVKVKVIFFSFLECEKYRVPGKSKSQK